MLLFLYFQVRENVSRTILSLTELSAWQPTQETSYGSTYLTRITFNSNITLSCHRRQSNTPFVFCLNFNGLIDEVNGELCGALADYVKLPTSVDDWKKFAIDFLELLDMSTCIGAIDGKHIGIRKPAFSGSSWHNYKVFFSMVLLASCDARYCSSFVVVGEYGSNNEKFKNGENV